jgi:ArsR family transcriptional regulator
VELSQAVKIFKALSCEQRFKLLQLLRGWNGLDECCDGVLKAFTRASEKLKISRSTISHHFKELENAGIIECRRNGQAMTCKVNEDAVEQAREFLSGKMEAVK